MTTLSEISTTIGTLAGRIGPSVVGVAGRRDGAGGRFGSGVVVAPGRVLTNAHNVWGEQARVTFEGGRSEAADVLAVDAEGDIAVLQVDTGDAPPVRLGSAGVAIGQPVFGVASPGGRGLRVTFGTVSATETSFRGPRGRRIAGSIEHTAPLLPGSSGGPIVDADGNVVGINTHRLGEGFYLAIPADDALKQRVDALSRGQAPSRPRLGVAVAPPHVARRLRRAVGLAEVDGLLVRGVEDDSTAAKAGLREGDVLIDADGRALTSTDDLLAALETGAKTVRLRVARGTEELTVEVAL
jgi:serine protease Do